MDQPPNGHGAAAPAAAAKSKGGVHQGAAKAVAAASKKNQRRERCLKGEELRDLNCGVEAVKKAEREEEQAASNASPNEVDEPQGLAARVAFSLHVVESKAEVGCQAATTTIDDLLPPQKAAEGIAVVIDASAGPDDERAATPVVVSGVVSVMHMDQSTESTDLSKAHECEKVGEIVRELCGGGLMSPRMVQQLDASQGCPEILSVAQLDGGILVAGGVSKVYVAEGPMFELKVAFHALSQGGEVSGSSAPRCVTIVVTVPEASLDDHPADDLTGGDGRSSSSRKQQPTTAAAVATSSKLVSSLVWTIWSDGMLRLLTPHETKSPRRLLRLRCVYQLLTDVPPTDIADAVVLDPRTICVVSRADARCVLYQAQGLMGSLPFTSTDIFSSASVSGNVGVFVVEKIWSGPSSTRGTALGTSFIGVSGFQASSGAPGVALLIGKRLVLASFDSFSSGRVPSLPVEDDETSGGGASDDDNAALHRLAWRELDLYNDDATDEPTCLLWHTTAALFCVGTRQGHVQLWCVWDGEVASCTHVFRCLQQSPARDAAAAAVVQLSVVGVSKILAVRSGPAGPVVSSREDARKVLTAEVLDVRDAQPQKSTVESKGRSQSRFPTLIPHDGDPPAAVDQRRNKSKIIFTEARVTSRLAWTVYPCASSSSSAEKKKNDSGPPMIVSLWAVPESQLPLHDDAATSSDVDAIVRSAVQVERQRHQALVRELKECDAARCALEDRAKSLAAELDQCRRPPRQVSLDRTTLQQLAGDFNILSPSELQQRNAELAAECDELRRDLATALSLVEQNKSVLASPAPSPPRVKPDDDFMWAMMAERQKIDSSEARNRLDLCFVYAELKVSARQRAAQKTLQRAVVSAAHFHHRSSEEETGASETPGKRYNRRGDAVKRVAFARGQLADPEES